jgi:hypothetical protein
VSGNAQQQGRAGGRYVSARACQGPSRERTKSSWLSRWLCV